MEAGKGWDETYKRVQNKRRKSEGVTMEGRRGKNKTNTGRKKRKSVQEENSKAERITRKLHRRE